jgi:RNA-directed DNA polymerase
LAKALAMAVLADAQGAPGRRTPQALTARAMACLGGPTAHGPVLPDTLAEQLRRLAMVSALEWSRLELDDVATWLRWGRWWRKAGVRNPHTVGAEPDMAEGDHFVSDVAPEDEEGHPDLPLASWTPQDLARAFRGWAMSPRAGMPLSWLLRPATTGPQPAWMDHTPGFVQLATAADVTQALALSLEDLMWLAPEHAHWRERHNGGHAVQPSHYRYRLLPKPSGGLRLLEAPLPRLAQTQRRILDTLLASVPVHEAAQGFVRGRGVGSHAVVHANQAVVIRFDLADFFTSINATRVQALWHALGHGRAAAQLLTRLTTTRTPSAVRERLLEALGASSAHLGQRRALNQRLSLAHLPQGAPTSPALANLCAFGLDVRLHALAQRFGARYTRYADDMVFSGPKAMRGQFSALRSWVSAIAQDEGFALRTDKTRVMPAHQRQYVTGLVVNQRVNYNRTQFDNLKAQLHRLAQEPQVDASERARVAGEIQWASQWLATTRTAKLKRLFDAIRFGP